MEAFMYGPPTCVWAMIIAGLTAIGATACITLYGGAMRAGLGRGRAALLAEAMAILLGGWFTATEVIAGQGWYRTLPWFPVAAVGFLATLLALSRIPVVARTIAAPGMASRLLLPHAFRVVGVFPALPDLRSPACAVRPAGGQRPPSAAERPGLLRDLRL
jgi:hypothetical protein